MDEDEAYDYRFVKWMIKEKVNISSFYYIGSNMFLKCCFFCFFKWKYIFYTETSSHSSYSICWRRVYERL